MRPATTVDPPIRVLLSLSPPNGTTRYVDQLVEGAHPRVSFQYFSWRTALLGRFDLVHIHWPELMIRSSHAGKSALRRLAMRVLIARCRVARVPLVRTVHNVRPHEPGSGAEERCLDALDRATTLNIILNPTTIVTTGAPTVTILHGHYRDRFAQYPHPEPVPGRALYFGIIRPYKGVELLVTVFRSLVGNRASLRIVGSPSPDLRELVEVNQSEDARITSILRFVDDETLVREVCLAQLVVLPYREMHNSGALLVALSLDRPVLVPFSPSNESLAAEVGPRWIQMYEGELTSETFERALAKSAESAAEDRPKLDARDWRSLGDQTYSAYLEAKSLLSNFRADS